MTLIQEEVLDRLRRMILEMEMGPGERLTERGLETLLNTSRTSVRPALLRLQTEGLVRREGRSWIVSPIDLEEIEQLFVFRATLEISALRLAGIGINPVHIAQIEELLAAAETENDPAKMEEAGRRFHLWIADLAENRFITRAVADAMTKLQRVRWLEANSGHHGWEEHRAILSALRNGQIENATNLLAAHIDEARSRLVATLQKNRRTFRARGYIL